MRLLDSGAGVLEGREAFTFGLVAAAITAIALATLVALDARRAGASLPAPARGP